MITFRSHGPEFLALFPRAVYISSGLGVFSIENTLRTFEKPSFLWDEPLIENGRDHQIRKQSFHPELGRV